MVSDQDLLAHAWAARSHAYAPYSGFAVGSAVLTMDGHIFVGCNVENATYPLTVCAERVAIANAVSAGEREIVAIAVVTDADPGAAPCGACRQVIHEFGKAIPNYRKACRVLVGGRNQADRFLPDAVRVYTIDQLLPEAFDGDFLLK